MGVSVILAAVALVVVLIYACCSIAGRSDDAEDNYNAERSDCSGCSHLVYNNDGSTDGDDPNRCRVCLQSCSRIFKEWG